MWFVVCLLVVLVLGCAPDAGRRELPARLRLTVLHTSDTHSQLFPFRVVVGPADAARGLGKPQELREVGGFARLSSVLARERAAEDRVVHVDSGDLLQGSRTFERFGGEPEVLAFDALGVDAQALGNHELDGGAAPLLERYGKLATFPLLAANLVADGGSPGLASLVRPFALLDAGGLRVAVIGVGNVGSVRALGERPNDLAVLAADAALAVQARLDELRPLVDVVVLATHLGLGGDEALVRATSGVDLVLGGHQHLTLDAPRWVDDCSGGSVSDAWGRIRECRSRPVPVVHSGAYGKFVGWVRLELDAGVPAAEPLDGYEVAGLGFELLPVHEGVPPDPGVGALLERYVTPEGGGAPVGDFVGFAPAAVPRFGPTGGDSPLGNLAAAAARRAALADLAVLGASSLRHDLPPGLLSADGLVRVLPFEDALVRVRVEGRRLLAALEQAARSAAGRDCRTQVHVAGALVRFACPCTGASCARLWVHETALRCDTDAACAAIDGACDAAAGRCRAPVLAAESYELATTAYLARGGSGLFPALDEQSAVVVSDTLWSAVLDALRDAPACRAPASCDAACPGALRAALPGTSCERAVLACRELPCVDASAGAVRDGRIRFELP